MTDTTTDNVVAVPNQGATMQPYVGTKLINACPMTRGDYNALRGWTIPEDENPADDGYLVEYMDGGAPNHPAYSGYISWSPKGVFERAYQATGGLTVAFGGALALMRQGCRMRRKDWGDGVFLRMDAGTIVLVSNDLTSEWTPTKPHLLAEDWELVQ